MTVFLIAYTNIEGCYWVGNICQHTQIKLVLDVHPWFPKEQSWHFADSILTQHCYILSMKLNSFEGIIYSVNFKLHCYNYSIQLEGKNKQIIWNSNRIKTFKKKPIKSVKCTWCQINCDVKKCVVSTCHSKWCELCIWKWLEESFNVPEMLWIILIPLQA